MTSLAENSATNHCHQFVEDLVAAAEAVRRAGDAEGRSHRLAVALVEAFVPSVSLAGIDLQKILVGESVGGPTRSAEYPDVVRGFRPRLVAGGQGSEALRHFAAAAAAVLNGRCLLVPAAVLVDALQVLVHGNFAEARAEIADDRAGAAVGGLLAGYLNGELDREELARRLRTLLCA